MEDSLELAQQVEVLACTPRTLRALLGDLSPAWTTCDEGPGTFSALDVLGHLIDGEREDWIPRLRSILSNGPDVTFEPFDRIAFRETLAEVDLDGRLALFDRLRKENLETLHEMGLTEPDLERQGMHPEFGLVTAGQLLTSWVVHDLGHIAQIVRVMSRSQADGVGPWREYLPVLTRG